MSHSEPPRQLAFAALTDCCRLWLGSESTGAITSSDLDWPMFARLAFVHSLEPLLHAPSSGSLIARDDIPPDLSSRWERAYFENFVFNQGALTTLAELSAACADRGLQIAAIKGPVAIARLYRDPALRVLADLDVLCHRRDLAHIERIAGRLGFSDREENAIYHTTLRHRDSGLLLELHTGMYDFLLDSEGVHSRLLAAAEPLTFGEFRFPALPEPLEAAVATAHLVNHDLAVALKHYLDLAATPASDDFERTVREVLQGWDLLPEYEISGAVLTRLFGNGSTRTSGGLAPADRRVVDGALRGIAAIEHEAQRRALGELVTRPGLGAKARYLRRLLLPPTPAREDVATQGRPAPLARIDHLRAVVRRGWTKLRSGGLASSDSLSLKRQIYARRRRQRRSRH